MIGLSPINPTDLEDPCVKVFKRGEFLLISFAREISEVMALVTADIYAALYCLLEIISRYLNKEFYVELGDFGTCYPGLNASGLEKPEEVIPSTVNKVKVMFPSFLLLLFLVEQFSVDLLGVKV